MSQPTLQPARSRTLFQSGYLRQIAGPMLMGAVVMLICGVLLLGYNVQALRAAFDNVQHSDDVLMTVSDLKFAILDHELTVRGYALTGNPMFLRFRDMEVRALNAGVVKLSGLMADDKIDRPRLARLKAMLDRHTKLFDGLLALGPGHSADIAKAIVSDKTFDVMNATRKEINDMRAVELTALAERQKTVTAQTMRTYALTAAIVILAFGFGLVGIALSRAG